MTSEVINKVAQSSLDSLDLSQFYPNDNQLCEIDIKKYLFMELIIKEKDFREKLSHEDFLFCKDKYVCVFCSVDAVIPMWVYMLLATYLKPFCLDVYVGTPKEAREFFFTQRFLKHFSETDYTDKKVVFKGCGEIEVSEQAYFFATSQLLSKVKSIFYGEPCSTVPIYKKK